MQERYSDYLVDLAKKDPRICILTAENRIFIKTVEKKIPERLIDVGISEQNLIGVAAGLAIRGKIPIVHCLASFLTMRAFEFIRTDLGYQRRNVKLVGTFAGFFSEGNGPTHQAIEDLALMRGIPNMVVLAPSDIADLELALKAAVDYPGPAYIRFNNLSNDNIQHQPFEIGKSELICDGNDVAIMTYGVLLKEAVKAARVLSGQGVSVRVINLRFLKPIDKNLIIQTAKETKAIFTLEDHFLTGGLAAALAEVIASNRLNIPFYPIGLDDTFFPTGSLEEIIRYQKMDADSIIDKVNQVLNLRVKSFRSV